MLSFIRDLERSLSDLGRAGLRWCRLAALEALGAILGGVLTIVALYVIFGIVKLMGGA